jgi:hypothetical protein
MPAVLARPPTKMFDGRKDAPKSTPSGLSEEKNTAKATTSSESSSRVMSTPSSLAPMSTVSRESPRTSAHAMSVQTYQGQSMPNFSAIWPETMPPKKPKMASCTAR